MVQDRKVYTASYRVVQRGTESCKWYKVKQGCIALYMDVQCHTGSYIVFSTKWYKILQCGTALYSRGCTTSYRIVQYRTGLCSMVQHRTGSYIVVQSHTKW